MTGKADFALAKNIGFANAPRIMQDYVSLVATSDDPEVKRRALELFQKFNEKEAVSERALFEFRIDMSGMISGTIETKKAEVIEADDQRPADTPLLETLETSENSVIDLSELMPLDTAKAA